MKTLFLTSLLTVLISSSNLVFNNSNNPTQGKLTYWIGSCSCGPTVTIAVIDLDDKEETNKIRQKCRDTAKKYNKTDCGCEKTFSGYAMPAC